MPRVPHDIFKHILSFKDPRYEKVRSGEGFGKTPTRVWYTASEARFGDVWPVIDRESGNIYVLELTSALSIFPAHTALNLDILFGGTTLINNGG